MVVELDYLVLEASSQGKLDKKQEELLIEQIREAYGPDGLGILTVKNVPNYTSMRKNLLQLAQRVATLPKAAQDKLTDPGSNWSVGWSHGVEILEDGTPDLLKGSFYANPNFNSPLKALESSGRSHLLQPGDVDKYSALSRDNKWPTEEVPELESALLGLGNLITKVGCLLAEACDKYIQKYDKNIDKNYKKISEMIAESICNKARLLHYFPQSKLQQDVTEEDLLKWCGVHCDHSLLTGLCRATFLDKDYNTVNNSDPKAGLYIVLKDGSRKKIAIPEENVGFQLGQSAQLVSNNFLRATPHLVRAPLPDSRNSAMKDISRNTFAVFLQPFWGQRLRTKMKAHELVEGLSEDIFSKDLTFGEFSEKLIAHYYRNLNSKL